jgi:hypothetical protein
MVILSRFTRLAAYLSSGLCLIFSLTACNELQKDLATAPDDTQITRYGLSELQLSLGTQQTVIVSQIQQAWDVTLNCTQQSTALASTKRKYIIQDCSLPKHTAQQTEENSTAYSTENVNQNNTYTLWGETVESIKLRFFEENLVQMELIFKINDRYEDLYKKHAKRLFAALGKPDTINLERIVWQTQQDRAILREIQQGRVHLLLQNKLLNDQLIETHQQMER